MCIGNGELGVDGRADVEDGLTGIEVMGRWRTRIKGGCTSSDEKTEDREYREEMHVYGGLEGLRSSHTKVYEGNGMCERRWTSKVRTEGFLYSPRL